MNWDLVHTDVEALPDSKIVSKTYIVLKNEGDEIILGKTGQQEDHLLGAKRVLVDAANMLKRLAHEMENKADKLK